MGQIANTVGRLANAFMLNFKMIYLQLEKYAFPRKDNHNLIFWSDLNNLLTRLILSCKSKLSNFFGELMLTIRESYKPPGDINIFNIIHTIEYLDEYNELDQPRFLPGILTSWKRTCWLTSGSYLRRLIFLSVLLYKILDTWRVYCRYRNNQCRLSWVNERGFSSYLPLIYLLINKECHMVQLS